MDILNLKKLHDFHLRFVIHDRASGDIISIDVNHTATLGQMLADMIPANVQLVYGVYAFERERDQERLTLIHEYNDFDQALEACNLWRNLLCQTA